MIASMTAYAQAKQEGPWGTMTWELRAVNHRYLDLNLRLPETTRHNEPAIREAMQTKLQRGKVEAQLRYTPGSEAPVSLKLNETLLNQLADAYKTVHAKMFNVNIEASQLMNWPGVIETNVTDTSELDNAILQTLNSALEQFVACRKREGNGLKKFILERCQHLNQEVDKIADTVPAIIDKQREKLLARAAELQIDLDHDRLAAEVLLWAQKADVAEEVQRLRSHIEEVERIVNQGGVVGRRLDFLMQELNREANTLSSKSISNETTKAAVEMKVLIEQMREQVQNIE